SASGPSPSRAAGRFVAPRIRAASSVFSEPFGAGLRYVEGGLPTGTSAVPVATPFLRSENDPPSRRDALGSGATENRAPARWARQRLRVGRLTRRGHRRRGTRRVARVSLRLRARGSGSGAV